MLAYSFMTPFQNTIVVDGEEVFSMAMKKKK